MRQEESYLNDNFKFHFDNVYETMDMAGGGNILGSGQFIKVAGDQA